MLVARITNLLRGLAARWIGRRERRNPELVYEAAIQARLAQYGQLRQAAAGVLYMRGKLATELERANGEHASVRRQLEVAVERDDDAAALALITRRGALDADTTRLTTELEQLTAEAEAAKRNLIAFQGDIVRLREEKARVLARLANAKARLRLQGVLDGLTPDADIRALEEVREHVERLVAETQVNRELGDGALARRLGRIREAEATAAARAQLEELKRTRRENLLPLVIPTERRARETVPATTR